MAHCHVGLTCPGVSPDVLKTLRDGKKERISHVVRKEDVARGVQRHRETRVAESLPNRRESTIEIECVCGAQPRRR